MVPHCPARPSDSLDSRFAFELNETRPLLRFFFRFSSDFLARFLVSFGLLSHVKRLRRHLGNLLFAGRQCQGFAANCHQTTQRPREFVQKIPSRHRRQRENLFWNREGAGGSLDLSVADHRSEHGTAIFGNP
jgi:hypothetical protein